MKTLEVKRLKQSEWQVYKQVQLEALKNDQQAFATPYEKMANFSDQQWQERFHENSMVFVAMNGNTPVGLVGMYRPPDHRQTKPDIWGMYVNSNYRKMGLGRRLMENVLKALQKEWSVKQVGLMVNSEQESAVKFYEKLGFKKVSTQDYVLGDGKNHLLFVMEKEL
jgi:ribosomal protein S18 acetylase RimI-like enzyme